MVPFVQVIEAQMPDTAPPMQIALAQLAAEQQLCPPAHAAQAPPQSTALSAPSR